MAQRIAPRSYTIGPRRSRDVQRRLATLIEQERGRFAADPRLFLWQAGWSPIWLGSNGPPPRLWQRAMRRSRTGNAVLATNDSGAGGFIQSSLDRLAFRLWLSLLAGSVLRGLWLGLLIVAGWVLLASIGLGGLPSAITIAVLAGIGAVAGAAYGTLHPIEPSTVAVMLDRTFGLDERLTTANGQQRKVWEPAGPVLPRLQLADAANALGEVTHELPRAALLPVREVIALLVVLMALLTGIFAYVPDHPVPAIADAPVPRFVPASERLANPQAADRPLATTPEQPAASTSDVRQQAQQSQQAREDLGVLGEALQDHPLTQAASEAIASGDYGSASEMIRSAASQAPEVSQEERGALADDLDGAADQVAPTNPDLADASREAADDLRQDGAQSGDGLDDLADTVDETAGVVPVADGAEEGQAGEQGSAGAAQPGVTGEQAASGGDAQQDAGSAQGASGQSPQPAGESGDPGDGVAAKPGIANEEMREPNSGGGEPGEMSGGASSGQSQAGAGGAPDPNATDGESGSGQAGQPAPAGNGSSSEGEDAASDSGSQGLVGAPDDETSASQGSGAGTGQSGANDETQGDQKVDAAAAPAEGEAAEPPPVGEAGDAPRGTGENGGSAGEVGEGGGTNGLSLQGTSDEGVRTGGTSGSSSTGSGAGTGSASGDLVRQQVGVAGPDANRIPDGMQDVVEDFFTEPGGGR